MPFRDLLARRLVIAMAVPLSFGLAFAMILVVPVAILLSLCEHGLARTVAPQLSLGEFKAYRSANALRACHHRFRVTHWKA